MARAETERRRQESISPKKKKDTPEGTKVLNLRLDPADAKKFRQLKAALQLDSDKETIEQLIRLAAKYTPLREAVDMDAIFRAAYEGTTPSSLTFKKPLKAKPDTPGNNSEPRR